MAESDNESGGQIRGGEVSTVCREQDRYLPIANVSRIMKKALPANAKISKEAKETVQECVSEFISFITGEASDKCQKEKRKTINGDDLLWAMTTLGFEDYVEPLKLYLHKYREMEGEKTAILGQAQHRHQAPSASSAHDHADANANAATTLYAHHGGAGGVINMMMMPQHQHQHHHHHHQHHHH